MRDCICSYCGQFIEDCYCLNELEIATVNKEVWERAKERMRCDIVSEPYEVIKKRQVFLDIPTYLQPPLFEHIDKRKERMCKEAKRLEKEASDGVNS